MTGPGRPGRRRLLPAKLRATSIHLAISGALFVPLLYFIVVRWYPGVFFFVDGGWQGVRLAVLVYLVLGPLLTFVVSDPGKSRRKMRFDFTCIGIAQALALVWSAYAVHGQRPIALAFAERSFFTAVAFQLEPQHRVPADLTAFSDTRPPTVFVAPVETGEDVAESLLLALNHQIPDHAHVHRYRPFLDHLEEVFAARVDVENMAHDRPALAAELTRFLDHDDGAPADYRFVAFRARYGTVLLAFTPDGRRVGALYGAYPADEN